MPLTPPAPGAGCVFFAPGIEEKCHKKIENTVLICLELGLNSYKLLFSSFFTKAISDGYAKCCSFVFM